MKSLMVARKMTSALFPIFLLLYLFVEGRAQSEWPQWGGPSRNFVSTAKGLAASWPEKGPRQLWSRPLGQGHSSIAVAGNVLYTMYSQGEQEIVLVDRGFYSAAQKLSQCIDVQFRKYR